MRIKGGRSQFYQWELDQLLIVEEDCTEVQFFNGTQTHALCCAVKEVDGERVADVPNELLQTAADLHAYAWDDESKCVVGHRVFRVEPKAKPAEYAYTQTEVLRYRELAETGRVYIAAYDPEDPWGVFEELEEAFFAGNLLICIKDDYVYQLVEYVPLDRFTFQREDADGIHRLICYVDAWKTKDIPREAVLYSEKALTTFQQQQARNKMGAIGNGDKPWFAYVEISDQEQEYGVAGATILPEQFEKLPDDTFSAVLAFYGSERPGGAVDEKTILRNISNPVQSDDAATKGYVDGIAGDIETALDSILAIQNKLIGGDGA